jgi:hypothetical protein
MNRVRDLMKSGARRALLAWIVALIATACLAGCGARQRAAPLDVELAREVLKTSLEAWKKGDSADSLKNGSPSIIAQDPDWVTGARLVAYTSDGDDRRVAENLFVPVKLTLKLKNGKQATKNVTYVIGTSPQVMVFRSLH